MPTLQKDALNLRICTVDEVIDGDAITLRARFDFAKPYIMALRKALSPDGTHLRRLEAIRLKVARRAEMELSINGATVVEELDPWRHSLDHESLVITVDATRDFDEIMDLAPHAIADGLAELFELQSGADFVPYLTASSEGLRRTHLQRALPSLSDDELDSLIGGVDRAFTSPFAPEVDAETLAAGPAPAGPKPPAKVDLLLGNNGSEATDTVSDSVFSTEARPAVELTVQQRQAQPIAPPVVTTTPRRTLRVTAPTGPVSGPNGADPNRAADAEHWTGAFERANGRWPQIVAHLQGTRAFGCDCLSFETAEKRAIFRANPERIDLVSRFIETKSGSVRFSDNEWTAASKLGERYYIYRVSFVSGGRNQAQLTIVRNPLARREAIRTERELLVDKVPGREEFDLLPVEAPEQKLPEQATAAKILSE